MDKVEKAELNRPGRSAAHSRRAALRGLPPTPTPPTCSPAAAAPRSSVLCRRGRMRERCAATAAAGDGAGAVRPASRHLRAADLMGGAHRQPVRPGSRQLRLFGLPSCLVGAAGAVGGEVAVPPDGLAAGQHRVRNGCRMEAGVETVRQSQCSTAPPLTLTCRAWRGGAAQTRRATRNEGCWLCGRPAGMVLHLCCSLYPSAEAWQEEEEQQGCCPGTERRAAAPPSYRHLVPHVERCQAASVPAGRRRGAGAGLRAAGRSAWLLHTGVGSRGGSQRDGGWNLPGRRRTATQGRRPLPPTRRVVRCWHSCCFPWHRAVGQGGMGGRYGACTGKRRKGQAALCIAHLPRVCAPQLLLSQPQSLHVREVGAVAAAAGRRSRSALGRRAGSGRRLVCFVAQHTHRRPLRHSQLALACRSQEPGSRAEDTSVRTAARLHGRAAPHHRASIECWPWGAQIDPVREK